MQVAQLYVQAFGPKLGALALQTDDMDRILIVCHRSLQYGRALYAIEGRKVLGFVGLQEGRHGFLEWDRHALRDVFGPWGGLYRWFTLRAIRFMQGAHGFRIAGLAVVKDRRGQGIGTRLLEAALAYGREHGYDRVRLEVIGTNTSAIQLYERLGFQPYLHIRWGSLTRRAGFDVEIRMERRL